MFAVSGIAMPSASSTRAHGGERVHARADAADALGERPRVARVAALEDHLQAAPHRARGDGVGDLALRVDVALDAQVPFDAADGIDDNALAAVVELEALGLDDGHGHISLIRGALFGSFLDGGHRGMRHDGRADHAGGDEAHLVGVRFHPEGGDVGEAVVERSLVPEPVLGAADAAVARLDREGGRPRSSAWSSRRCRSSGPCSPPCRGSSPCARPRRRTSRRTGRRRSAAGGSTCRGSAGCRTSSGVPGGPARGGGRR